VSPSQRNAAARTLIVTVEGFRAEAGVLRAFSTGLYRLAGPLAARDVTGRERPG